MEKQVLFESRVDIMTMPSWPATGPPDLELGNGHVSSSPELPWSQKSLPQFNSIGYSRCGLPCISRRGATTYNYGYSKTESPDLPGLLLFGNDDDFSEAKGRCTWLREHRRCWTVACWTSIALLSLITLAVLSIVLTWLIIIPRRPDLKLMDESSAVQSLSLTRDIHYIRSNNPNVTTGEVMALFSANFTLQLLVKNPNRVSTDYSSSTFSFAYQNAVVGNVTVPAFSQKQHATTQQLLETVITDVVIPPENAFNMLQDATINDTVSLDMNGHVHARLKILGLATPSVKINLWCSVDIKMSERQVTNQQCHT